MLCMFQVYAVIKGNGNIIVMMKRWITTGSLEIPKEELQDKELFLSYKLITLENEITMQVNKVQIKDDKSVLYINVTKEKNEILPLMYTVVSKRLNEVGELYSLAGPDGSSIGVVGKNPKDKQFVDSLELPYNLNGDEIIELAVQNNAGNTIKELEINLQTREIMVFGETDVEPEEKDDIEFIEENEEEKIKKILDKYFELSDYADGDILLEKLTELGKLNYDTSKEIKNADGSITTNINYSDYKKVMLNYVSENEFEKNWTKERFFSENKDGYLVRYKISGEYIEEKVESFIKESELSYKVKAKIDLLDRNYHQERDLTITLELVDGKYVVDNVVENNVVVY